MPLADQLQEIDDAKQRGLLSDAEVRHSPSSAVLRLPPLSPTRTRNTVRREDENSLAAQGNRFPHCSSLPHVAV